MTFSRRSSALVLCTILWAGPLALPEAVQAAPLTSGGSSECLSVAVEAPERIATAGLLTIRLRGAHCQGGGLDFARAQLTTTDEAIDLLVPELPGGPAAIIEFDSTIPLQVERAGQYTLRVRIDEPFDDEHRVVAERPLEVVFDPETNAVRDCLSGQVVPPSFEVVPPHVEIEPRPATETFPVDATLFGTWCNFLRPSLRRLEIEGDLVRVLLSGESQPLSSPRALHLTTRLGELRAGSNHLAILAEDPERDQVSPALLALVDLEVEERTPLDCNFEGEPTVLCLGTSEHAGRFEVEATWRAAGDPSPRPAQAQALTPTTGTFSFFGSSNREVMVKTVEACGTAFDSHWFFFAGLTNLEVEVTVTDLTTGLQRRYTSPLGEGFDEVLDTEGFACP